MILRLIPDLREAKVGVPMKREEQLTDVLKPQDFEARYLYFTESLEKMVIELSALVIYNHTLRYDKVKFRENPLSYVFRLCDDMKEWDRLYFNVNKKSNFLICSKCRLPITRGSEEDREVTTVSQGGKSSII